MEQYTEKAEKNLFEMQELLTKRNEKILLSCSILSYCVMCLTAFAFVPSIIFQIAIIVFAVFQLIISIYTCYKIEKEVGALVCPNCGAERKATGYDVLMSPHVLRNVMKCPECGKRGFHKRMVEMLIDEAKEKGVTEINLDATEMGRTLYEALGFECNCAGMVLELNRRI